MTEQTTANPASSAHKVIDPADFSDISVTQRCGKTWVDASENCGNLCLERLSTDDCPAGEKCYFDLPRDVCAGTYQPLVIIMR